MEKVKAFFRARFCKNYPHPDKSLRLIFGFTSNSLVCERCGYSKRKVRIYKNENHQSWGNHIFFFDFERRRISGHLTPLPEVGDEWHVTMKSGNTMRYEIFSVEPCRDPRDMFFGMVKEIGYLEPVT